MKKISLILCLFLCLTTVVFAQSKREVKRARQMMSYYDYNGAMVLLENAMRKVMTPNPEAVEALAECYFKIGDMPKAERTYNWLLKMNTYTPEAHKNYGEVLVYLGQYEEAKEQFSEYLSTEGPNPLITRFITSCDVAMQWIADQDTTVFRAINDVLFNTKYSEWGANFSHDGKSIMFFSDRPAGKLSNVLRPFRMNKPTPQDIAKKTRITPVSIYSGLHEGYHLGPIVYTKDGKGMVYSRTSSTGEKVEEIVAVVEQRLEIEEAILSGGMASKMTPFDFNNPSHYSVGHPCLSPDENVLYFVSDMPDGYGGTDIYFCVRNVQGHWSEPVNAGSVINTEGNEMFPTMDANGILYFSSNGHPGYGGLDIFRAKGEKNKWVIVENLRDPVNSSGDDFYLTFNKAVTAGYFASNRQGGMGSDDVYSFVLTGPLPDVGYIVTPKGQIPVQTIADGGRTTPPVTTVTYPQSSENRVTGRVVDSRTNLPIDLVNICLVDKASNRKTYTMTSYDGTFTVELAENTTYYFSSIKDGYIPIANYEFQTGDASSVRRMRFEMKMKSVESRSTEMIISDNIVLDTGQGMGIEYSVQVLANKEYPDWTYLDEARFAYPYYKIYYGSFPDAYTRFTIGRFKQLKEANSLKDELRALGYNDAFVVMFINGKRKVVSYH